MLPFVAVRDDVTEALGLTGGSRLALSELAALTPTVEKLLYDVRCPWAIQRFDAASDFALHMAEEQDAHIKHQERLRRLHEEGKLADDEVQAVLQPEAEFSRRVDARPK